MAELAGEWRAEAQKLREIGTSLFEVDNQLDTILEMAIRHQQKAALSHTLRLPHSYWRFANGPPFGWR